MLLGNVRFKNPKKIFDFVVVARYIKDIVPFTFAPDDSLLAQCIDCVWIGEHIGDIASGNGVAPDVFNHPVEQRAPLCRRHAECKIGLHHMEGLALRLASDVIGRIILQLSVGVVGTVIDDGKSQLFADI